MTSPSEVVLEFEDLVLGIKHAELRRYEAVYAGLTDRFRGADLSDLEILKREAAAVCAEIAVAKWLGLKLALRINTFHHEADLGQDIEVRCVLRPNQRLQLRQNDNPSRRYILVHMSKFKAKLMGWIHGYDGMMSEYVDDPGGRGWAWFVPQGRLYEMSSFEK